MARNKKHKCIRKPKRKKSKNKCPPTQYSRKKKKASTTSLTLSEKAKLIFRKFLNLDEIRSYLSCLVKKCPTRIDVKCIGQSAQGSPILMACIKNGNKGKQKDVTLVEAGSNGSDFYSVSSALYLIDYLTNNPSATEFMDYMVIPCSNPDGYMYSLTEGNNNIVPIDLSHNFPLSHLCWSDLSRIQTDEFLMKIEKWKRNYRYDAPETCALNNVLATYNVTIKLLISLQEGGEKIVYPFGCCDTRVNNEFDLLKVAKSGADGFRKRCFSIGSIYNCCGLTYGSLIDFIKFEQTSIKFMYIVHLFKKNSHSYRCEKIKEYGSEVANCIKYMAKAVCMLSQKNKPRSKCAK